jgi:hypothetical protein
LINAKVIDFISPQIKTQLFDFPAVYVICLHIFAFFIYTFAVAKLKNEAV